MDHIWSYMDHIWAIYVHIWAIYGHIYMADCFIMVSRSCDATLGGESLYFGKPFLPIYDLARRRLSSTGIQINDDRILAIGDGITTDILGAEKEGIDSLCITGGLAALETGTKEQPDQVLLEQYLKEQKLNPTFSIGHLR